MKTGQIRVNDQVRKDMGDIAGLKKSIQENGILQPLLIDKNNTLIAGHRRLQAAKELTLEEVPVQVIDVGKTKNAYINMAPIIQLVENIHRKDLDPIEESDAYNEYMAKHKTTIEELSRRIGKTKEYIQRRVNLKNLVPEASKALKEKKIELGHALLLNQMKKNLQKEAMNFITEYDLTVQNFADQIRWMGTVDFMDIEFRREETDGTKQKTLLGEVGKELDPKYSIDEGLQDNDKFKVELGQYVESQRKVLREKGIIVFCNKEEVLAKHPGAYQVGAWNKTEYNKAVTGLPNSKTHAVVIDLKRWAEIEKDVYSLIAKKEKKAAAKEKDKPVTEEDKAKEDKMLENTRKEKLKQRVQEYIRKYEERINMDLLTKDTKVYKAIQTLFDAHNSGNYSCLLKTLMKETPAALDKECFGMMANYIPDLDSEDMKTVSEQTGLDWSKHWGIDKEFLELHTKAQLIALAKELKLAKGFIEDSENAKKSELIEEFMGQDLKNKVPKIVGKKQ